MGRVQFYLIILAGLLLVKCRDLNHTKAPIPSNRVDTTQIVEEKIPETSAQPITYHMESTQQWLSNHKRDSAEYIIILAVNRVDKKNISRLDSFVVPSDMSRSIEYYFPFPFNIPSLNTISKIIFFSYPAQAFGVYENGQLIYTGPTSMGKKRNPTPTGIFYTNWKAKQTTSTFNDEWDLKWNFNIENKLGVGWHQYALPGYPASHSCLRLHESDARYLYNWADQWIVDKQNNDSIIVKGTPVVIFGSYDFDKPKPWLQLVNDPHALDIDPDILEQQVAPHINDIMVQQERRKSFK